MEVPRRPYSVLLPVGFAVPPALPQARCALTAPFHPCRGWLGRGGLAFSVALSLGSPPPDVIRHRMSMESGLSSTATFRSLPQRPSGRLTDQVWEPGCLRLGPPRRTARRPRAHAGSAGTRDSVVTARRRPARSPRTE